MTFPCLDTIATFPSVNKAMIEPDGLLCYGGRLTTDRLISAYQQGIFPWYGEEDPLLWWSPSYRMILPTDSLHVSRSLEKAIKQNKPSFFFNRNFEKIITTCATIQRKDVWRYNALCLLW